MPMRQAAGHDDAGVLAGVEQGGRAVGVDLLVGLLEDDPPAVAAEPGSVMGGEALDDEARLHLRGLHSASASSISSWGRTRRSPGRASRAPPCRVGGGREVEATAALAGDPVVHGEAVVEGGELGELVAEERGLGGPRECTSWTSASLRRRTSVRIIDITRGEAAAGGEHEQRTRVLRQDEVALRRAEEEHVTRLGAVDEGLGDRADRGDRGWPGSSPPAVVSE